MSQSDSPELFLEDLSVGMRFHSPSWALDPDQIKAFATAFDPQPFHLDDTAAQASLFGGLAASGWHTAAITMKLLTASEMHIAGGLIGAGVEISWPRPTRPGDILHVDSEVLEITRSRSRPDRGLVICGHETLNQHGEVVQSMRTRLIVPCREAAPRA